MKNPSNSAVETRIPPLGFVSRNWREGDKFRSSARNSIVRRELWAYVSAIACEIFSTGSLSGNAFTSAVSLYLLSVHEKVSDWSCQTLLNWACIACRPWNDWLTFEVLTPGLPPTDCLLSCQRSSTGRERERDTVWSENSVNVSSAEW